MSLTKVPDRLLNKSALCGERRHLALNVLHHLDVLGNLLPSRQLHLRIWEQALFALKQDLFSMPFQLVASEGFGAGLR